MSTFSRSTNSFRDPVRGCFVFLRLEQNNEMKRRRHTQTLGNFFLCNVTDPWRIQSCSGGLERVPFWWNLTVKFVVAVVVWKVHSARGGQSTRRKEAHDRGGSRTTKLKGKVQIAEWERSASERGWKRTQRREKEDGRYELAMCRNRERGVTRESRAAWQWGVGWSGSSLLSACQPTHVNTALVFSFHPLRFSRTQSLLCVSQAHGLTHLRIFTLVRVYTWWSVLCGKSRSLASSLHCFTRPYNQRKDLLELITNRI